MWLNSLSTTVSTVVLDGMTANRCEIYLEHCCQTDIFTYSGHSSDSIRGGLVPTAEHSDILHASMAMRSSID